MDHAGAEDPLRRLLAPHVGARVERAVLVVDDHHVVQIVDTVILVRVRVRARARVRARVRVRVRVRARARVGVRARARIIVTIS